MENSKANQLRARVWLRLLKALAPEHVASVEVVYIVFLATNPAKLVLTLGTYHVVASTFLFLNYQTALGAVSDLRFVLKALKILPHSIIKLCFAVLALMVRQPALDTDLILAPLALPVIGVEPRKNALGLLFKIMGERVIILIIHEHTILVKLERLFVPIQVYHLILKIFQFFSEFIRIQIHLPRSAATPTFRPVLRANRAPTQIVVLVNRTIEYEFLVLVHVVIGRDAFK